MDDKWFMFVENNVIKYIRSWTGIEIFRAKFEKENDFWKINTVRISTELNASEVENITLFNYLISHRTQKMKALTI